MKIALEKLYALLCDQRTVQQSLLNLSYEKRQVISKNDTERLSELVQEEFSGLSQLKSIEKRQETILQEFSTLLEVPVAELTLSAIIEHCEYGDVDRFIAIQKELSAMLKVQLELNELNRTLLETHLDYTEMMLNLMVNADVPVNNYYGTDGMPDESDVVRGAGLFDGKA